MDRVFLDANILFSAAYRSRARLQRLWQLPDVDLLTSPYAVAEARRNLSDRYQRARLTRLVRRLTVTAEPESGPLPTEIRLPDKDRPIFLAAQQARAGFLITGDVAHFGPYFGHTVAGVTILAPAEYLARKEGEEE